MFGIKLKEDKWRRRVCILLGCAFLIFSYWPFEFAPLAYLAIFSFLGSLVFTPLKKAFRYGYFFGFLFSFVALYWISHVTGAGWIFAAFFQALYMGMFAVGARALMSPVLKNDAFRFRILFCIGTPALWTSLEILRVNLPGFGFGWNLLSYTQIPFLAFVQIADVIGAYGVSFVIVFLSCLLFLLVVDVVRRVKHRWLHAFFYIAVSTVIFISLFQYGFAELKRPVDSSSPVKIGAIQGNIPQELKWVSDVQDQIVEKYIKLSEILNYERPDMIVWPEASYPGFLDINFLNSEVPNMVDKMGIPLLVGAPRFHDEQIYNSSFLLEPGRKIHFIYDKQYLVPFGEYVPLKNLLFFLDKIADSMGVGDFSKGENLTIFKGPFESSFATLICFENIFPELARKFANLGAEYFIVVTNDAWFKRSVAPWQHFSTNVLRAIEVRKPFVQVANTGVTGFIDAKGQVQGILEDKRGESLFVSGGLTQKIYPNTQITPYVEYGHLLPWTMWILAILSIGLALITRRSSK
jgi:apolipoprotein N-acyltransferase